MTPLQSAVEAQPKVGDRVKITILSGYCPSENQGLLVGNTATIIRASGGTFGLKTDNAKSDMEAVCYNEKGWTFFPHEIEIIPQESELA